MPHIFDTGNASWLLMAAAMVLLMAPGLAFFYGGLAGKRNILGIMIQSFVSMGITTIIWFICGYSMCFSGDALGSWNDTPRRKVYPTPVGAWPRRLRWLTR